MTKEFGELFSLYFKDSDFFTRKSLGKATGINSRKISKLLKGDRSATIEEGKRLAAVLVPFDQRPEFCFLSVGHSKEEVEKFSGRPVKTEVRSLKTRELKDSKGNVFGKITY